jgi:hypothetical protein
VLQRCCRRRWRRRSGVMRGRIVWRVFGSEGSVGGGEFRSGVVVVGAGGGALGSSARIEPSGRLCARGYLVGECYGRFSQPSEIIWRAFVSLCAGAVDSPGVSGAGIERYSGRFGCSLLVLHGLQVLQCARKIRCQSKLALGGCTDC